MANFGVEILKVATVTKHPQADRLDLVTFEGRGWTVCSQIGNHQVGSLAVYFPVESVLTPELVARFGIEKYYSKKLKAAKLVGIYSEGLAIPLASMEDVITAELRHEGANVTEVLGVTKWVEPIPVEMQGQVERGITGAEYLPEPENIKRYPNELVLGEEVYITEKIHGTTWQFHKDVEGNVHIGSHSWYMKDNEVNKNNLYIRAAKMYPQLWDLEPGTQVFGEVYGNKCSDLHYGHKDGQVSLAVFGVRVNHKFLHHAHMKAFCAEHKLPTVPELYVGPFSMDEVLKWNNADSTLAPGQMMEGVVIVPTLERSSHELRRVCLKFISERYQLRKGAKENK